MHIFKSYVLVLKGATLLSVMALSKYCLNLLAWFSVLALARAPLAQLPSLRFQEHLSPVRREETVTNEALFFHVSVSNNMQGSITRAYRCEKMPLDHFAGSPGTFKNRYWVNDTYYKIGGPVFRML